MRNKYICIASACLIVMFVSSSFGQDDQAKKSGNFFDKDFVTGAFEGKGSEPKKPVYAPLTPSAEKREDAEAQAPIPKSSGFEEMGEDATPTPSAESMNNPSDIFAEGQGVPVKSISVIADGTREEGLPDLLASYGRLIRTRKLGIGTIYMVGHYGLVAPVLAKYAGKLFEGFIQPPKFSENDLQKMNIPTPPPDDLEDSTGLARVLQSNPGVGTALALFSNIRYTYETPDEYPVKVMPTWILNTESGDVILEGLRDPSKYLNLKGEFVMKDLLDAERDAEDKAKPAPVMN